MKLKAKRYLNGSNRFKLGHKSTPMIKPLGTSQPSSISRMRSWHPIEQLRWPSLDTEYTMRMVVKVMIKASLTGGVTASMNGSVSIPQE